MQKADIIIQMLKDEDEDRKEFRLEFKKDISTLTKIQLDHEGRISKGEGKMSMVIKIVVGTPVLGIVYLSVKKLFFGE